MSLKNTEKNLVVFQNVIKYENLPSIWKQNKTKQKTPTTTL